MGRRRHELAIGAPAARICASLLDVGSWWSDKRTYSGESRNLSIDARAGGCFCEKLPNGAVEHMRVVFLRPNEVLRMGGALGPLQAPTANGTKVDLTYSVGGFMAGGFEAIAPGAPAAK